jgi:hypothetical protein
VGAADTERRRWEVAYAWTADDEIVASDKSSAEEDRRCYYSWLENYLKQLEGKEAYIQFQERYYSTPEYYALVASLAG